MSFFVVAPPPQARLSHYLQKIKPLEKAKLRFDGPTDNLTAMSFQVRPKPRNARYEISVDGVPRRYRDRQDIALQTARFLKSRNPHSVVKLKDLRNSEETVVAFQSD